MPGKKQLSYKLSFYNVGEKPATNLMNADNISSYSQRKCADTTNTVLVPWASHFQC